MEKNAPVTPERIFQIFQGYQASYALKTAIDLDIFTKIYDGNKTISDIAKNVESSERGIRILCDSLTVLGFLTKENNEYILPEISSEFLNRKSLKYIGDSVYFLMNDKLMQGFSDLPNAVKKGGSTVSDEGSLDPESPMWVKFARGMMGMMMPLAHQMVKKTNFDEKQELKVLDIAAGHGIFGITIAQKYKNAEIHAVDWKNVLDVAKENAEIFGVSDRYKTIDGSAFDVDFGNDYDLILLTNFLHHFDKITNEKLLSKINNSLKNDGKVITLEFIPNEDRISPPGEAMFSLTMLATTPAGDAYTFNELQEMFEKTGFSKNEDVQLEGLPQHIVISEK